MLWFIDDHRKEYGVEPITGRSCYATELSPAYVDIAIRRWEEFTGQETRRKDRK